MQQTSVTRAQKSPSLGPNGPYGAPDGKSLRSDGKIDEKCMTNTKNTYFLLFNMPFFWLKIMKKFYAYIRKMVGRGRQIIFFNSHFHLSNLDFFKHGIQKIRKN